MLRIGDLFRKGEILCLSTLPPFPPASIISFSQRLNRDQIQFWFLINKNSNVYLDRINFPDSGGINCLYERDAVNITNPNSVQGYSMGLPNMLVSLFDSSYRAFIPVIDTSHNTSLNGFFENAELFEIYPNPAINKLELRSSKLIDLRNISIFDLSGKKLINYSVLDDKSSHSVQIDHLPPGFYFIEVKSENYVGRQKFWVQ